MNENEESAKAMPSELQKALHRKEKGMTERIDTAVFESHFTGVVLTPGDEGYDERRTVWNAMVDRRPAVIARCLHT